LLLLPRLMSNRGTHSTRRTTSAAGFTMVEMAVVLAVIGIISAIALPVIGRALTQMRLTGAARTISNLTASAKTKAAAGFTRARVFVDLTSNSYHMETWNGVAWVASGGIFTLPTGVNFGFGVVGTPPTNTQPTIKQAPNCLDNGTPPLVPPAPIANTACFVFNSRGIPIDDSTTQPTQWDALYITDSTTVLGVTVTTTGLIGVWTTPVLAAPQWTIS
jgi:prepilin-type N-terminal cleavage/methylation domain-containing protein